MKRSKHNLSHYRLFSADMGVLTPMTCFEVLPGDSIQQASSLLVRVSPLLAPVMHPVSVRIHHWYVPYRLLWDGWEDFITGGPDGEGGSSGAFPTITAHAANGFTAGQLADYLGLPVGAAAAGIVVSALPFRAYARIFNEYYRDQDLVTALTETTAAGDDTTTPIVLQDIAWEKDPFTAARPWPQKGPEVTLPLGTTAPVVGTGAVIWTRSAAGGDARKFSSVNTSDTVRFDSASGTTADRAWGDGVTADTVGLEADLSAATAASVNDLRLALALQRYQEARSRYGSRYSEYLRYLGVRSSDARLQRPEYLGGGKQTIQFSEVLQTGVTTDGDDTEGVGNLKGHGITAARSRRYRRFFEEHGVIISLLSVRPRTMYAQQLERFWSRRTKEDFWQRELEHIGQQEVYSREIYGESDANGGSDVFGYNDRYSEYRHINSSVAGEFRSTLNYWHMARIFSSAPALNQAFTDCDPTTRIYASTATDPLWIMANHNIQARRMVSRNSTPRIF